MPDATTDILIRIKTLVDKGDLPGLKAELANVGTAGKAIGAPVADGAAEATESVTSLKGATMDLARGFHGAEMAASGSMRGIVMALRMCFTPLGALGVIAGVIAGVIVREFRAAKEMTEELAKKAEATETALTDINKLKLTEAEKEIAAVRDRLKDADEQQKALSKDSAEFEAAKGKVRLAQIDRDLSGFEQKTAREDEEFHEKNRALGAQRIEARKTLEGQDQLDADAAKRSAFDARQGSREKRLIAAQEAAATHGAGGDLSDEKNLSAEEVRIKASMEKSAWAKDYKGGGWTGEKKAELKEAQDALANGPKALEAIQQIRNLQNALANSKLEDSQTPSQADITKRSKEMDSARGVMQRLQPEQVALEIEHGNRLAAIEKEKEEAKVKADKERAAEADRLAKEQADADRKHALSNFNRTFENKAGVADRPDVLHAVESAGAAASSGKDIYPVMLDLVDHLLKLKDGIKGIPLKEIAAAIEALDKDSQLTKQQIAGLGQRLANERTMNSPQ